MITENQHSIVIKIGNGREYIMAKEVLFYEKPWGDKKVYDMIQHAATKTWFNQPLKEFLKEYLIPLADRMEVEVDVEILDNSLQPEIDDDLPFFDLFNL